MCIVQRLFVNVINPSLHSRDGKKKNELRSPTSMQGHEHETVVETRTVSMNATYELKPKELQTPTIQNLARINNKNTEQETKPKTKGK